MRLRLVLLVLATTSLVLTAFLLPLALLIRTFASDSAVDGAVAQAQSLTPVVATVSGGTLTLAVDQLNTASPGRPVTVFLPDGSIVGVPAPVSDGVRLARSGRSITDQVPGGLEVLVSVQGLAGDAQATTAGVGGTAVIRVFVPDAVLRHGVVRAWLLLVAVGVGLLLLSALVADSLARSLVRPLADLARASDRLSDGDLTARAEPAGPREVRRVGTALNGLAERIGQLLTREREYGADLSHRLRTPLTALRIDAEGIGNPESRERVVEGVDGVERASTRSSGNCDVRCGKACGRPATRARSYVSAPRSGRRWPRNSAGRWRCGPPPGRCRCGSGRRTWPRPWTCCSTTSSRTHPTAPPSPWS